MGLHLPRVFDPRNWRRSGASEDRSSDNSPAASTPSQHPRLAGLRRRPQASQAGQAPAGRSPADVAAGEAEKRAIQEAAWGTGNAPRLPNELATQLAGEVRKANLERPFENLSGDRLEAHYSGLLDAVHAGQAYKGGIRKSLGYETDAPDRDKAQSYEPLFAKIDRDCETMLTTLCRTLPSLPPGVQAQKAQELLGAIKQLNLVGTSPVLSALASSLPQMHRDARDVIVNGWSGE